MQRQFTRGGVWHVVSSVTCGDRYELTGPEMLKHIQYGDGSLQRRKVKNHYW